MRNDSLLQELLAAESEDAVVAVLNKHNLLVASERWKHVGNIRNNSAPIFTQQSSAPAALVEKNTNAIDALLLAYCKALGIDPRGKQAREELPTMSDAVEKFFPNLTSKDLRKFAAENLVLYATGSRDRPCLALYDSGEGQFASAFPNTFCSLIHADASGSYKGAIPFVQGRFNMGGTGVLPYCGEKYMLQLIVSRVPPNVAKRDDHEWAYTLFCYFPSEQDPAWKYLVGPDGEILTAGAAPLALVPDTRITKGYECLPPRERKVSSGTLIKMYDYKVPKGNICGDLYRKLEEFLLQPALPLRIVECRPERKAKVMSVTMWDALAKWRDRGLLEENFEEGASIAIHLDSGQTIPAEIRVFKLRKTPDAEELDVPLTGVRALINGQSHAHRTDAFFKIKAIEKEHVADSMLVTLDCTGLGQDICNKLFMSNRETFREGPLLQEILKKLQKELHDHEALTELNQLRYAEKVKDAVDDNDGIRALEELLSTDPTLAALFGSEVSGKIAKTAVNGIGGKVPGTPEPFKGLLFPTYVQRRDGSKQAGIEIPQGDVARVTFMTDVRNDYFTRKRPARGRMSFEGALDVPSFHLFNGRLTFTCAADKSLPIGTSVSTEIVITDKRGSGPFKARIDGVVVAARPPAVSRPPPVPHTEKDKEPLVDAGPSRPNIKQVDRGPDALPATVEKDAKTGRLAVFINTTSKHLEAALAMRKPAERPAVRFVYIYGLALVVMGLLDTARGTEEWKANEGVCREEIAQTAIGVARVIVPLCLSLPKNLPKSKS